MNALAKEFIQKNYDNVLGPGVFIMLCSNLPYPVMTPLIEEIIEEAPDRFKNNSLVCLLYTSPISNNFANKASGWGMNFEGGYYVLPDLSIGAFINYRCV